MSENQAENLDVRNETAEGTVQEAQEVIKSNLTQLVLHDQSSITDQ